MKEVFPAGRRIRKRGRLSINGPVARRHETPYLVRVQDEIERTYAPENVRAMVDDLCKAEDQREGKSGMMIKSPNWRARESGLKILLQLVGSGGHDQGFSDRMAPANIIINVQNRNDDRQSPVEVVEPACRVEEIRNESGNKTH